MKVELITETGCHIFMGMLGHNGYGRVYVGKRKHAAHRVIFGLDKIPNGMVVCHKCDVRSCVNPDHLFLGTHKDNEQDKISKGRRGKCGSRKIECIHGDNNRDNQSRCKSCRNLKYKLTGKT